MSVEVTRLPSGLTVVTAEMPHLQTASLGVWVGSGSRDERPDEHGISHLLEHMAFKGTKRRSALDGEQEDAEGDVEHEREDQGEGEDVGPEEGDEHDELQDRADHGQDVSPAPIVGDAEPAQAETDHDDDPRDLARSRHALDDAEHRIDVGEDRGVHQRLRLALVEELPLVHTGSGSVGAAIGARLTGLVPTRVRN